MQIGSRSKTMRLTRLHEALRLDSNSTPCRHPYLRWRQCLLIIPARPPYTYAHAQPTRSRTRSANRDSKQVTQGVACDMQHDSWHASYNRHDDAARNMRRGVWCAQWRGDGPVQRHMQHAAKDASSATNRTACGLHHGWGDGPVQQPVPSRALRQSLAAPRPARRDRHRGGAAGRRGADQQALGGLSGPSDGCRPHHVGRNRTHRGRFFASDRTHRSHGPLSASSSSL